MHSFPRPGDGLVRMFQEFKTSLASAHRSIRNLNTNLKDLQAQVDALTLRVEELEKEQ